jgi:HAMP domain-containing protein
MKLLARFNLIFIAVLGLGLSVAIWLASNFLRANAKEEVLAQANLMMETTLSTRTYTATQIQPLLNKKQAHDSTFLPQTVPAYAATEIFNNLRKRYPDYAYKEATLNPTNPRDRATDWEADVVNQFRNNPSLKGFQGERSTPTGKSLFLARPLRISNPACLECHSTPAVAPVSMIKQYGPDNGFGWKLNEIVGAQIVSVPESLPLDVADRALKTFVIYMIGLAVVIILILDLVLVMTVIRPVAKLSHMADDISQGKLATEDLPISGRDEISVLASSFNRMQRSLARAMKMLEGDQEE